MWLPSVGRLEGRLRPAERRDPKPALMGTAVNPYPRQIGTSAQTAAHPPASGVVTAIRD